MIPTITAFENSPDGGQGLARDMTVRWASGADWLDDAFNAGDLLMVQVLRRLNGSGLLEEYPNLVSGPAQ